MKNLTANIQMRSHQLRQQGFTLVELMVAMAISLFMLVAIALVYQSSKTGFVYANNTVRMSEDASYAIDSLSRDIRMATYGGCVGTTIAKNVGPDGIAFTADDTYDDPTLVGSKSTPNLFNVSGITGFYTKPNPSSTLALTATNAIQGFPGGTGSAAVAARASYLTSSPNYAPLISTDAEMLYIAGGSSRGFQVNTAVAAGQPNIVLAGAPYTGPGIAANDFMMIADCKGSEIFRVTSMTNNTGTLVSEKNLINAYSSDALVMPLETSTYFLATRARATTPSLYRRFFTGSAAVYTELVPNVEAMAFQYGINTSVQTTGTNIGAPTYRADSYVDAAAVTDWSRVVSVRIGLIVVTEDANQTSGTQLTSIPWIKTNAYLVPTASQTDRRLRRAYNTTVSIRNRSGL